MILYSPVSGDVLTAGVAYRPRTAFVMTQLDKPVPPKVTEIRQALGQQLEKRKISVVDAESEVTGRDFLEKIWRIIISVPLGIAIVTEEVPAKTIANVFYEIGLMQAYGKETLVVKTPGAIVPSDFVRTEYVEFGDDFGQKIRKYLNSYFKLPSYFEMVANQLERNPLLSIDYLRRAFLISGDQKYREMKQPIYEGIRALDRARNSVEGLLAGF